MKKSIVTLFVVLATTIQAATNDQWNIFLAYHNVTDIEPAGNMIYVLSSNDLFSYNINDNSVRTYNKTNVLSDTEIKFIAWNPTVKKLIIIYSNNNIDLLDNNGNCENISSYYSKILTNDKTINNVTIYGIYAYISTGFCIMKLNMRDAEISETYKLGQNVADCAVDDRYIYAKTVSKISSKVNRIIIIKGDKEDNLLDKVKWKVTEEEISFWDDNDIMVEKDRGYNEHIIYDKINKCYWSNQSDGCLQGWRKDDNGERSVFVSGVNADGPRYNDFGFMKFTQGSLYCCGSAAIQTYNGNNWEIFQEDNIKEVTGVDSKALYALDVDPRDKTHVMACARNGVYEYKDTKFVKFFNDENSTIQSFNLKDKELEMVTGLIFDKQGNAWCFNSQAPERSILKYSNTGKWSAVNMPELMKLNDGGFMGKSIGEMKNPIWDSRGLMWFVNDHWANPSLYSYNIDTNKLTTYSNFVNQDRVQYNLYNVKCLAEDRDGNIWIGTKLGLFYLTAEDIASGNTSYLNQYKVSRNNGTNQADYLMANIDINDIEVDAANRKWIGTSGSGVYLISADNDTQEQHFTADNSGLLSDDILSIAIDDEKGEVFFGTQKGLCSYVSKITRTNEEMTKDNVWAYPNPVRRDYTGPITITGLTYDADVKICSVNGTLVNEGRSMGGAYIWDGCDFNGEKVVSGIYMVQTATKSGGSGTVCKIAIIK